MSDGSGTENQVHVRLFVLDIERLFYAKSIPLKYMLLCSTVFGILFELTSKIIPVNPSVRLYFIDTIEL